jgi:hypothetical protein
MVPDKKGMPDWGRCSPQSQRRCSMPPPHCACGRGVPACTFPNGRAPVASNVSHPPSTLHRSAQAHSAHRMFAQAPATPRPIAPGRAKRKVPASGGRGDSRDTKQSPPPPYDRQGSDARPRPDNLLGSPVPMTTQMVEYFAGGARSSGEGSPAPEQWVDEQSQQEMRNLLARAEEAIQERENG